MNINNPVERFVKEDMFDLTGSSVDITTGNQEINDCSRYLQINEVSLQDVFTPVDVIKNEAFQILYQAAQKLHVAGNYATALKIHFGINNNKICLFYQPVCLEGGKDISPKFRQYSVKEGEWYAYDSSNNTFVSINYQAGVKPILNNHKEMIRVRRSDGENHHSRFIPSIDVEAVIFPCQQIKKLIANNPNGTHIALFNSIRKERSLDMPVKHTLLLKSMAVQSSQAASRMAVPSEGQNGSYENLANLCPPNEAVVRKLQ